MKRMTAGLLGICAAACLVLVATAAVGSASGPKARTAKAGPFKIVLSMSYTGNDWQAEAANLIKAEAATPPYDKEVQLRVDVAGTSIPNQIRTLNNEIQSGANAIIVYPLSPTALNSTIANACKRGVVVFAYDSLVTAPCAYNVHDDVADLGYQGTLWLAKQMTAHGLTKLGVITGVAGTTADTDYQNGIHEALKKYPKIKIIAQAPGLWDPAKIKSAFSSMYAAHPDMQAVWGTFACSPVWQVLSAQHKPMIYCAGADTNAERILMLRKGSVKGAQGFKNMVSVGAPTYPGELALIEAVQVLQGKQVPKDTILPTTVVTPQTIRLGTNPFRGANVYDSAKVPPGMIDTFWTPLVAQGLSAVLTGRPDKVSEPKPCSAVPGCRQQPKLKFDKLHSGGN